MELFFDTETSGKFNFKSDYKDPNQPWVCQVALVLSTEEKIFSKIMFLIKSEGRSITKGAFDTHHITTKMCDRYGISEETACYIIVETLLNCDTLIAHNVSFDKAMISNLLYRNGFDAEAEFFDSYNQYCTMQEGTNIVKLPGRFGKFKWPTLGELNYFLFKKKIEGAHDALVDTLHMRDCYYEMQKL